MRTTHVTSVPYQAFPLAQAMHQSPARFRMVSCGRRFGKSYWAIAEVFQMLLDAHHAHQRPARGLVVSPTFNLLREDWRIADTLLKPYLAQRHLSDQRLEFCPVVEEGHARCAVLSRIPVGELEFKSADSQAGVGRGAGYDALVMDEAARIPREIWEDDLRPALSDHQGRAVFISTPFGRNWFYELWRQGWPGEAGAQPGYASWQYSTLEGWRSRFAQEPIRLLEAEAEWQAILASTSQRTLEQEYLAQFRNQEGQLWNIRPCLRGALRPALPGRSYVAGMDVAHAQDWMVTAIFEVESRQLVGLARSRHRSWELQKAQAKQALAAYPRCRVLIDSTGLGDPIAQDLRRDGLSVEDVIFTAKTKAQLIEHLALAVDQGAVGIPEQADTRWLIDEFDDYQETQAPGGALRYGAPSGRHDDGVTAVMLAAWGLRYDLRRAPPEESSAPRDEFSPQAWLAFTRKAQAWRLAYPTQPVPGHPNALSWDAQDRWRRMLAHV